MALKQHTGYFMVSVCQKSGRGLAGSSASGSLYKDIIGMSVGWTGEKSTLKLTWLLTGFMFLLGWSDATSPCHMGLSVEQLTTCFTESNKGESLLLKCMSHSRTT